MAKFVVSHNRYNKAKKIESVICSYLNIHKIQNCKILDIGCGNGEIISYFDKNNNKIYAIDAMNQLNRELNINNFIQVNSSKLPFESLFFDIIISNHVIEHIDDQCGHMKEIHRCLKSSGLCYYATPNKNFLVEPHHKIPLIHYFNKHTFHKLLKFMNLYEEDLHLLSYGQMKNSFMKFNFNYSEFTARILKKPKKYNLNSMYFRFLPLKLIKLFQIIIPTNIFILTKKN